MSIQDATEAKKKLIEINETISTLDPAIRLQAFEILAPMYFDLQPKRNAPPLPAKPAGKNGTTPKNTGAEDASDFFSRFDHKQPKDNVLLIAAWYYSQYGTFPITRKNISDQGSAAGLIVPPRSDNTMRIAKHNGKSLFQQKGKGWQLTIMGEQFLREAYSVTKGTGSFQDETDE